MEQVYQTNTDWKRLADIIVKPNQRVLVLGASDTGKTTFCRFLVDCGCATSLKTVLVDADIGQSQIGPPTTVGMKRYVLPQKNKTPQSEDNISETDTNKNADALYFVGAITPQRNLLPILTGTRLMVDSALDLASEFIVIDTTGYIHDGAASMLKQQKIDLIRPNHVVCIGRPKDLERIVGCYKDQTWLTVHRLLPHKLVRPKSGEARKRNRKDKFTEYFQDSELQEIPIDEIKGARTPFFNGRIANQKELEILSGLTENDVAYAEWGQRTVSLIARTKLTHETTKKLKDYLSLTYVASENTSYFDQRLVGMINSSGDIVAIGIIETIDYENRKLHIRCKTGIASDVKMLQFGEYQFSDKR